MSARVAHLSGLWKAGAGAMVRIHDGLIAAAVPSRWHSPDPVDESLAGAFTLPRIKPTRLQKVARKWRPDPNDFSRRIEAASKSNPTYEAFSPPVALDRYDLSGVLKDVDLLHLHWVGSYLDFRDFLAQLEIPVVWTLHDQNPYLGGFHYQSDVDAATTMLPLEYECRDIKRESLSGLNLTVVGNSDWNASQARTTGVLPENTRIERIYLPLPGDYVPLPKAESKANLQIDPNRFVLGFACAAMGNRRKGFADLVSAIERLPAAVRANTTLVSFGHPPTKQLRERVSIPWVHAGRPSGGGQQSPVYSAMDAFVIPSLEEAFGQTALEALACETPVLGTDVGGIPEMIRSEQTGLLFPPRSPHRLAESIERMFDDTDLRTRCGINGRALAAERHAPDEIAQLHRELYENILQRQIRFAA